MISYYLTQVGKTLLAEHTGGLTDITFNSIRLGAGQAADPVNSTTLADEKLVLSNPDVEQNANDDKVVTISVNISSADIETSFVCSELGLYADSVLLMVAHDDHPVTVPNKTVANPVLLTWSFNLIMSSTADTAIAIAPSGLVFIKQLNEHKSNTAAHVDTMKAVVDDSKSPPTDTNEIRELLSNIAAIIKEQTGKTDWKENPATDINTLNSKITGVIVDQTQTPAGDTSLEVDTAVSGLSNRENRIIGDTDWKSTPEISLKEAARLMSAIADNNDLIYSMTGATIKGEATNINRWINPYMPIAMYLIARTDICEMSVSLFPMYNEPVGTQEHFMLYWGVIWPGSTTGNARGLTQYMAIGHTTYLLGCASILEGDKPVSHTVSYYSFWKGFLTPTDGTLLGVLPAEFSGSSGFNFISVNALNLNLN